MNENNEFKNSTVGESDGAGQQGGGSTHHSGGYQCGNHGDGTSHQGGNHGDGTSHQGGTHGDGSSHHHNGHPHNDGGKPPYQKQNKGGYYGSGGYRAYGENHGRSAVLLVGIAGGTGSGKSTFTRELVRRFKGNVTVLSHDNYYRAHHDMSFEDREKINYDEPAAYETELLVEHLKQLKNGQAVECPVYDFSVHDRSEETIHIRPNKVVIVEGILIFADEDLCSLFDVRIFIDTDADLRLIRRIYRDTKRRGRSLESVLTQYVETVKPMHEKYVLPSRKRADMILPDGGRNFVALDMLFSRVKKHIDDSKYHSGGHKQPYKNSYYGRRPDSNGSDHNRSDDGDNKKV